MMMTSVLNTDTEPMRKTGFGWIVAGNSSGFTPRQTCVVYCRKSDIPIALMRYARRGAPRRRSGRYATRSIATASTPDVSIAGIAATRSRPGPSERAGNAPRKSALARIPDMNTSECAKLISSSTPYTSV